MQQNSKYQPEIVARFLQVREFHPTNAIFQSTALLAEIVFLLVSRGSTLLINLFIFRSCYYIESYRV